MTNPMNLVERVCRVPFAFYSYLGATGDSSWHSLTSPLADEAAEKGLTDEELVQYLEKHPEVIDAWIRHSEDKRCTPSHYFRAEGDRYVLGFVNADGKLTQVFASADAAVVCAKFVQEECCKGKKYRKSA
jgi:hypothetical protein